MRQLSPILFVILGLGFMVFHGGVAGQTEVAPHAALGSGFTYQGRLALEGDPADGQYDFQFRLYDAATDGNLIAGPLVMTDETVAGGVFTVVLDFGAEAFDGQARWLQIAVRQSGSGGSYSALSPRQRLTAAPYALHAQRADSVSWGNLLVAAESGGDFNSVQAALDSIDDAGPSNPYLVYVAPGVYEEQVTLKPHVTLEGAGEGTTIIRWTGGSQAPWEGDGSATLIGVDNATVRHLTVESDGAGQPFAVALFNGGASPTISHVTTAAWNAGDTRGVANYNGAAPRMSEITAIAADGTRNHALTNDGSAPLITDITATASGGDAAYAILHWGGATATLTGVQASASGADNNFALYANSASPSLSNVRATATGGNNSFAVYNWNGASPQMSNVTASASGGNINYGVFNSNASPTLTDVIATATGGSSSRGVWNANASPHMTNVTATARGSNVAYGVYNGNSSPAMRSMVVMAEDAIGSNYGVFNDNAAPTMTDVTVTASGNDSTNVAINNQDASPDLFNVVARATGGDFNWGVWSADSSLTIRHSLLEGDNSSVYASGGDVRVANSQLIGPRSSGLTCFDNYDETLSAITCP
ncbi:MAG TPA: pectinesterase family protein [Candidatus Sulfomarinibacteraceae bacterium]|nr:pectinesterase family protein [Candidatus Sulfomarinibacteraceae bacterium]